MRKSLIKRFCLFAPILFLSLNIISCISSKKIVYFRNLPDTLRLKTADITEYTDPVIQPDDILSISVQTADPQVTIAINQISAVTPASVSSSLTSAPAASGFLVDKQGTISIPVLGTVKLVGLTTYKARALITELASKYYKDPIVQLRFANYKITLLGEVAKPATYTVPNEKVSILDAIGLAGDLTIFGKRENVLLIREESGVRKFVRFDLNSSDIFKSPYFYLKQNDIIYVEPGKGKIATTNAARTQSIAIIGTALSVLIVLLSRTK